MKWGGLMLFLFSLSAQAARVVVFQDNPILTDKAITVETYYDEDILFTGFHTIVYSQRVPNVLFASYTSSDINLTYHQRGIDWISDACVQRMRASIKDTNSSSSSSSNDSDYELYDIEEGDESGI